MRNEIEVSICMIVLNEEANLKKCLDSFLPIIHEKWSELIIIDTGSTDRTVGIAKEYTDKVYERKFTPWDFSAARNYGIAYATGRRILIIDADEELTQESVYIFENVLTNPKYDKYKTIFLKVKSFYSTGTGEYAEVIQPRVFDNNEDFRFHPDFNDTSDTINTGELTQYVESNPGVSAGKKVAGEIGKVMTAGPPLYSFAIHNKAQAIPEYLFSDNIFINHYGYLFTKADLFVEKKERSLPMLEAEYETNPDDLHILTHLIKTYYATADHKKVTELGDRWIELMAGVEYHAGWYAYLEVFSNLMGAYTLLDDAENAERILAEALKYSQKLIGVYLILGQYYIEHDNEERARELFEEAHLMNSQTGDPMEMLCSTNTKTIMPEILNLLATMEFSDGNFKKAGEYINEGILLNENRLPLRWDIFNKEPASERLIKNQITRKQAV